MSLLDRIDAVKSQIMREPITAKRCSHLEYYKEAGLLGSPDHVGTAGFSVSRQNYICTSRSAGLYIGYDFMSCFTRDYRAVTTQVPLKEYSDFHGILHFITINNLFQIIENMPFENHYIDFLLHWKHPILEVYKGGEQYITLFAFFAQAENETRGGIIPTTLTNLGSSNIIYTDISEHYEEGFVNVLPQAEFFDLKLTAHITQGFGSKEKFKKCKENHAQYHHWFENTELSASEYMTARMNMAFTLLYSIEAALVLPGLQQIGENFLLQNHLPHSRKVARVFCNSEDRDKYSTVYFKNRHERDYIIAEKVDKSII